MTGIGQIEGENAAVAVLDGTFFMGSMGTGVSASYARLGDILIAEPDALIGFAGPRVISQTIGQELPEGFQRAEFLLEHGMLDMVVERQELRGVIARLLRMHKRGI